VYLLAPICRAAAKPRRQVNCSGSCGGPTRRAGEQAGRETGADQADAVGSRRVTPPRGIHRSFAIRLAIAEAQVT
jgi:hypothetical protein